MAEIRKHNPQIRDEIDKAIHAALGEDVRPVQQHEWSPAPSPHQETFVSPQPAGPSAAATSAAFVTFAPGVGASGWTALDASKVAKPLGAKQAPSDADDVDDEDFDDDDLDDEDEAE